ncbi:hypothetical protein [Fulvivirga sediminis]|uniref:CheC-like protein domain-containing protein n=1 Tax=Fulvivirga sediminis TaxID=2803949 RepID=A0A937K0M8_9BACT|nr:hypothetical protein [Fulvivirga sediminis]MBL3655752.1 hypothetical protein [Fulvivirga sediminis]
MKLDAHTKAIAIGLLDKGYRNAANSFSTLTNEGISIKPTRIEILNNNWKALQNLKSDKELILLTTSIMGEMAGKSYLLFNKFESEEIHKACMPHKENEAARIMETEAILMELDNILSAAVITEFSNYLDIAIYGDVPRLSRTGQEDLKDLLANDLSNIESEECFIVADTEFISENNSKLRPQFIWKLTSDFLDRIGNVGSKQKDLV